MGSRNIRRRKMNAVHYWNRLKGISACDICVMTGKEVAMYMVDANSDVIVINFGQGVPRNIIEGYIADSANQI